jgi:hypothetical protein
VAVRQHLATDDESAFFEDRTLADDSLRADDAQHQLFTFLAAYRQRRDAALQKIDVPLRRVGFVQDVASFERQFFEVRGDPAIFFVGQGG